MICIHHSNQITLSISSPLVFPAIILLFLAFPNFFLKQGEQGLIFLEHLALEKGPLSLFRFVFHCLLTLVYHFRLLCFDELHVRVVILENPAGLLGVNDRSIVF